ncbi:hypothetical protein SFRURICE_005560 [Spodoptera frugiperda]|nr:hypothetical protein SFRURICE_005560 [Spodoptera frugiperda]
MREFPLHRDRAPQERRVARSISFLHMRPAVEKSVPQRRGPAHVASLALASRDPKKCVTPPITAKIRSLYDAQLRLQHNIQPLPLGTDIANTVKYFSQTLLSVLKDVPRSPLEMLRDADNDGERMGLYPNLDYKSLFNALSGLVDSTPHLQYGTLPILQCLGCLLPFLEYDMIDNLPFLVAYCVAMFPVALHQEILHLLSYYILPFTITRKYAGMEEESQASQSVAAIIMMVFQHSNNPDDLVPFLCQRDMCPNAGSAEAAKVCYDHCISVTFASDSPPPLYLCIECANEIHREHPNQRFFDILHPQQQVSMVCENKYASSATGNRHNSRRGGDHVVHTRLPLAWQMDSDMQTNLVEAIISLLKEAKPINMEDPDSSTEQLKPPLSVDLPDPISVEDRQLLGRYGVWLMVGLCTPNPDTPDEILGRLLSVLFHWFHVTSFSYTGETASTVEKLKIEHVCGWVRSIAESHRGVLAHVSCRTRRTTRARRATGTTSPPRRTISRTDSTGHCHYYCHYYCLLPHPPHYTRQAGHWDNLASKTHHLKDDTGPVFYHITVSCRTRRTTRARRATGTTSPPRRTISRTDSTGHCHYYCHYYCLLPHPPHYTRQAGHWDNLASKTHHLKDGLNRLYCLIPYGIITQSIWDYIMPAWMEAICTDVPEKN